MPDGWRKVVLLYARAQVRLAALILRAIASGGLGSAKARRRYRREAQRILRDLDERAVPRADGLVEAAYRTGANRADRKRVLDDSNLGRVNREAVALLQDSLRNRLTDATRTVGRRVDDTFRREGLRIATEQLRDERPQEEARNEMAARLSKQGVTSFTDKSGREWGLKRYADMAIRTTLAEATNKGTETAMRARGFDLVTVSDHGCSHHASPSHPCRKYEGRTFSLTGRTEGYDRLPALPPWHSNCQHYIVPAVGAVAEREAAA